MSRFENDSVHKNVKSLCLEMEDEEDPIELNPSYQRDIVWSEEKMSAFINSVMRNIITNNIILTSGTDGTVCIDGRQRLTSLKRFKKNKIPVKLGNTYYYYSKIKDGADIRYEVFSVKQRQEFRDSLLPIVIYKNLSRIDQIDIFNRIQNGVALTKGELIPSVFENDNICKQFNKFCNSKIDSISKIFNGTRRKKNNEVIINIMYMINTNTIKKR